MSTWKIAVERERERERERELLALKANSSDLSRPPGGGYNPQLYNPQLFMRHPPTI